MKDLDEPVNTMHEGVADVDVGRDAPIHQRRRAGARSIAFLLAITNIILIFVILILIELRAGHHKITKEVTEMITPLRRMRTHIEAVPDAVSSIWELEQSHLEPIEITRKLRESAPGAPGESDLKREDLRSQLSSAAIGPHGEKRASRALIPAAPANGKNREPRASVVINDAIRAKESSAFSDEEITRLAWMGLQSLNSEPTASSHTNQKEASPAGSGGVASPEMTITSAPQFSQSEIAAGTKITLANWRRYRHFMSDGLIALFSGKYGLRMPADVEIDLGLPVHVVAPSSFARATEKYSSAVHVVHLPDGRNDIAGYIAGEPFPNPTEPDKGYKILADSWYAYGPHLAAGAPGMGLWNVTMLDRFGNATRAKWAFVYRQLAFNTDPGTPRIDPLAAGAFYTQWLMADEPEQAKYTVDLDILPQNNQQSELNYIYFPALRHSMTFSIAARCAPLLGTDWTHDDQKPGFNGGIADFNADFLRDMQLLSLVSLTPAVSDFPREYDMPLGFARPSWGVWSLRRAWVINVHRISSEAMSYCYSSRVAYIDRETARNLWEDLYDSRGRLWKVTMSAYFPRKVPGVDGETLYGRFAAFTWDLQNRHATFGNSTDSRGRFIMLNDEVPEQLNNVTRYSTPAGLMQIMR